MFASLIWVSNSKAANEKDVRILLFGDSIIAGYELMEQDNLTNRLQEYFDDRDSNVKIIDAGVSGDTTSGGRTRFEWTIEKENPDLIFLSLGGNDLLRGIPPKIVRQNIDQMLMTAKKKEIPVIVSQTEAPARLTGKYSEKFNAIFTELPEKYEAQTYPFLLNILTDKEKQLQQDGIHPNPEGIRVIVKDLGPVLAEYIKML
jgi:acyl-CoA thioesterase-1